MRLEVAQRSRKSSSHKKAQNAQKEFHQKSFVPFVAT
jgi:hypothetical protein